MVTGANKNKHGLSRHIPAEVARDIRARSKQGCIFCRALICEYEHIDPEFADAREHHSECICLVCPSHHSEITGGLISKAQVRSRYEIIQRDSAIGPPFHEMMLTGNLSLQLGDSLFECMPEDACVLRYDQEQVIVLGMRPDELFGGARPSISGTIRDAAGEPLITIEDNVITVADTSFDVVCKGAGITINVQGGTAISLIIKPPSGFAIDRLVMKYRDLTLNFDQTFGAEIRGQSWELPAIVSRGARCAVAYDSTRPPGWPNGICIVGGKGVLCPSGITLAEGAGVMWIQELIGRSLG
jgi:hypothetical protein